MKYTYQQPKTEVHTIDIVHVMAASKLGLDASTTNQVTSTEDLLVRENSGWDIWGSEEEYDEVYNY